MKKLLITLAAVGLAAAGAQARTLSPEEALGRAAAMSGPARSIVQGTDRVTPIYTAALAETDTPALYVISRGEGQGFVVVAADDVAAPMLGYSDTDVDAANLPESLKWWLSEYTEQIAEAIAAGAPEWTPQADYAAAPKQTIAPLCTTKWNQDSPYNQNCPTVSGVKAPTGCVATAMAQVIKYHNYPVQGIGSHTLGTQTFNYANTTFDYANMLDSYTASATAVQKNAVATLMSGCGIGVDMSYGRESSGAVSARVAYALREYFNYDKGVHMIDRQCYSSQAWEDIVYGEISANRPVYYSGRGESGGHAFVCDGYRDGYFHFNWGWGGMSDGYYRLYALVPGSQGIGGNSEGFNTSQSIIVGAQPPVEGSTLASPYIAAYYPLTAYTSTYYLTVGGQFTNESPYKFDGRIGVALYNAETGELVKTQMTNATIDMAYSVSTFKVSLLAVPDGRYKAVPVVEMNGVTTPIHLTTWDSGYFYVTRQSGTLTVEMAPAGDFTTSPMELASPMYTNKIFAFHIPYTYTAEDDYLMPVLAQLRSASGSIVATGERMEAIIKPGQNVLEYVGEWLTEPAAGDYQLWAVTYEGLSSYGGLMTKVLGGPIDVTLTKSTGSTFIRVNTADWSIAEGASVDNVTINAKVQCVMGYYAGAITARIYPKGTAASPVGEIKSPNFFINSGQTADLTISGEFLNGVVGQAYDVYLYSNIGTKLTNLAQSFTVGESAIDEIEAIDPKLPVEYFNLQGQPVGRPEAGQLVIRRQGTKADKVYFSK